MIRQMTSPTDLDKATQNRSYLTEIDELVFLLEEVPRRLRQVFDEAFRRFGLTRTQWRTLGYVFRSEGLTQTELAQYMEMERASIGQTIDRLEALNYVERRKLDGDRRVWKIYLLPEALVLLPKLREEADVVYEGMLSGIPEQQRQLLHELLRDLANNLGEGRGARKGGARRS